MGLDETVDNGAHRSTDRRVVVAWVIVAALVGGNLFLHKPFSDVCDALFARIGRGAYERWTLTAIAAISLIGAVLLLRRRFAALTRAQVVVCLLGLTLITLGAQRWLLVSNVEMIHLPQFGLLAALLLVAGVGPRGAWLGATLAGVLDEAYQWLVIYAALPVYFDYNDIVLNAIGAAWAVLLGAAGRSTAARRGGRALYLVMGAALLVVGWLAPPRLAARATFPYWQPSLVHAATGFDYHVMSASEGLAVLLLLWLLVRIGTTPPARRPSVAAAAVALSVFLAGCGAATRVEPGAPAAASTESVRFTCGGGPEWQPFIVTFWCGPPTPQFTDQRAAEIAAAGFTVVGPPCEGAMDTALNLKALAIAERHGLQMWIFEPRINPYHGLVDDWEAQMDTAVQDYGTHPALAGYFIIDEPGAEQFGEVGRVVARLREVDSSRLGYVNILPDYIPPEGLGTATYREHVDAYMETVRPKLLSYDYYPFKHSSDRDSYFDNLELVRSTAARYGVPFLLIVQAMPHGPYRDPSEAEIAWQVHHALAFGARGISYFAYWTPVHVPRGEKWRFRNGLIEQGRPTEHYHQVARINAAARAIAAQLTGWRSLAVVDTRGHFGVRLPIGPLADIAGGRITAGLFGDGAGSFAALLVNQDYRAPVEARIALRDGAALPHAFDPATGAWQPLPDASVALPPAGAVLLRWDSPVSSGEVSASTRPPACGRSER